jgi:hypothetical protein
MGIDGGIVELDYRASGGLILEEGMVAQGMGI